MVTISKKIPWVGGKDGGLSPIEGDASVLPLTTVDVDRHRFRVPGTARLILRAVNNLIFIFLVRIWLFLKEGDSMADEQESRLFFQG